MNLYECIGRLVVRAENAEREHARLFNVIRGLKAGDLSLDKLAITDKGWTYGVSAPVLDNDND